MKVTWWGKLIDEESWLTKKVIDEEDFWLWCQTIATKKIDQQIAKWLGDFRKTSWKALKLQNEGRMKNDVGWRMMKDDEGWWSVNEEWWRMNDEGWWFQAVEGFCRQTNAWTDICDCRVAFATEKVNNKQS